MTRKVLIQADKESNREKKLTEGTNIIIEAEAGNDQYTTQNVTQDGIVRHVPSRCDSGIPVEIKEGDHVYAHHFLCDEDNKIKVNGVDCYIMDYEHIYCVVSDGEIRMLSKWNFVEPIEEAEENYKTESGIYLKPNAERIGQRAIACHLSKEIKEQGVKEGDRIIFHRVADYPILVEGKEYYRIEDRHIEAIDETGVDYDMGSGYDAQKKLNALSGLAAEANKRKDSMG
jgi:co-chaperonin GroES (HSP10)